MGKYEDELRQIINEGRWSAPNYAALDRALAGLEIALNDMSQLHQTSWSGTSGDAARAAYAAVMDDYRTLRLDLEKVERIFDAANVVLDVAAQCLGGLPSTVFPQEIHDAMEFAASNKNPFIVVRGVSFVADSAMNAIEGFFGAGKENDAKAALESMRMDLARLSDKLPAFRAVGVDDDGIEIPIPDPIPEPDPVPKPRRGGGGGGYVPSGGGYVPGGGSGTWNPGGGDPESPTDVVIETDPPLKPDLISVDDRGDGIIPGGSSGAGSLAFGGAAGAAALRAGTTGGFGGAGGGLTGQIGGTGGLLGARGAGGAGGAATSGTGAGAGGRGAMMAGGGGAGTSDKSKRPGTAGYIAPKFEEDPDITPLPEGARAGGRRGKRPPTDDAPGA